MNPTNESEINSIRAADFLMNHDPNGVNWIKKNRTPEQTQNSERSGRRRRRNP